MDPGNQVSKISDTVEPRYHEVLSITDDFLYPSNGKIYWALILNIRKKILLCHCTPPAFENYDDFENYQECWLETYHVDCDMDSSFSKSSEA